MNKICVTGHKGFIGSHIKDFYENKGVEVQGIDKDETMPGSHIDLSQWWQLERLIKWTEDCDLLIHCAAQSHVDHSIFDPITTIVNNITSITMILEACRHTKVPLLHFSTDEVYGHLEPTDDPWTENDLMQPRSPYSASKAAGEHLVNAYTKAYGIQSKIIRCSNVYGPRQGGDKFIPITINALLNKQPIPIHGDGQQVRSWVYVSDVCEAVDFIALDKGWDGEVYNIAGDEFSVNDVSEKIWRLYGEVYGMTPLEDRSGQDRRYAVDDSKLYLLGWKPKVKFEDGLKKTIDWFRKGI